MRRKTVDKILKKIKNTHNFRPEKRYPLYIIKDHEKDDRLWNPTKYSPPRKLYLPRDPLAGWRIYDIETLTDFESYFEDEFENLPDGKYAVHWPRGGNKGFAWFFILDYEDGTVKKWYKKSKGKEYGATSRYTAFQKYFNLREKMGV